MSRAATLQTEETTTDATRPTVEPDEGLFRAIWDKAADAMALSDPDGRAWALVAVRDRGIGIPAADLPLIAQRFHRATNVPADVPGTGLGLASARHILELHGGSLAVESEEGRGSTFAVRLPP